MGQLQFGQIAWGYLLLFTTYTVIDVYWLSLSLELIKASYLYIYAIY